MAHLEQPDGDAPHLQRTGPTRAAAEMVVLGPHLSRKKIAIFVWENRMRIRRRVRGKLGAVMRKSIDSEDILSTVMRRLDRAAVSGKVRARSEQELWCLIMAIANIAIADNVRRMQREARARENIGSAQTCDAGDGSHQFEYQAARERAKTLIIAAGPCLKLLDGNILTMRSRGMSHTSIAGALGADVRIVRVRWQVIKRYLRGMRKEG